MKKLFNVAIAILMMSTLVLAACGKNADKDGTSSSASPDNNQSQPPARAETVQIEFWHSLGGVNGKATDDLVQRFNETVGKEKGIKVESVYQGDDVTEKLKTVAQANDTKNFPDVGLIYGPGIPATIQMKQLVPAEDLYGKYDAATHKEDLEPNAIRAFSYQDKLISMPYNISTILLYYNKDMYESVGLDPNAPPQTIAEMAEHIKKLMIKNGDKVERHGLNVNVRRYQMANWIGGQGEYNFFGDNEGGRSGPMTKVTFGEDGTLRNYLTEWSKVIETGGYKEIEDNINEEFATEKFGIAIMSTSRLKTIRELVQDKFEWSVAYLPKVNASDKGGASVGGGSLAVFDRGDENKVKASWEFVQYMASPDAQLIFHQTTGYIPVNKKVYDLDEMKNHLQAHPEFQTAVDQLHASHPNVQEPFDIINWEIDDIIRSTMIDFAQGKLTLDQAHDRIVEQCNEKLAAYHRANS